MVAAYCQLFLVFVAIFFFTEDRLRKFLRKNSSIADERVLQEYQKIVRSNMYLTLIQIVAALSTVFLGTILVLITTLSFALFISCANGVVFSLWRERGRLERRARSLPTADRDLEEKYRRISEIWRKKLLPLF
jgi:hypothetical protein